MSKKYIRILSLCLCAVLLLGLLAGCSGTENIAPAENTYVGKYSVSTAEQDPNIKIDGVLDDACWQGKKWFSNTYANSDGTMPTIKLTAFPCEYGIYVASVVTDTNLSSNGGRYPHNNTSWELYVVACDVDQSLADPLIDGYWHMKQIYVNLHGESMSLCTNTERAVVVEGELNSNDTQGATLEMLVPWDVVGVDTSKGIPESIGIYPAYRASLTPGAATTYMFPAGGTFYKPSTYHMFTKDGYVSEDKEGAIIGNAYNGQSKSGTWDLSRVEENIITSTNGQHAYIFFPEIYAENFVAEATLIPVKAVNDDWPKAGISIWNTDGLYYNVMLDPGGANALVDSINGTKNFANYQITTYDQNDGNWNQNSLSGYDMSNPNAANQEGVKLTVVKYGNQLWYFADGKYLTSQQVTWLAGKCYPGLFTLGFEVIYKDYSCREIGMEDLKGYLENAGMYSVEAQVSGKGGEVSCDATVAAGGNYTLSLTTESGYKLSSVLVNGEEKIADVRANTANGQYTITNAQTHQSIVVSYEKIDGVTYSGKITDGDKTLRADIVLVNTEDGSAYYVDRAGNKGFEIEVPAGTYEVRVRTDENPWQTKTVTITEDMVDDIVYQVNP